MVNFFQDFKIHDPAEKKRKLENEVSVLNRDVNRTLDNLDSTLAPVGPIQDSKSVAITHLYQSIEELDTETNEIDKKIVAHVTNS